MKHPKRSQVYRINQGQERAEEVENIVYPMCSAVSQISNNIYVSEYVENTIYVSNGVILILSYVSIFL